MKATGMTKEEIAAYAVAQQPTHDPVNNPAHYTQGSVECTDAIEAALGPVGFIEFLRGQVIKYTWRMALKGAPLQDAQKGQWYGNLLVEKFSTAGNK